MGQLQRVFDYEGQQVRTTLIDGRPWFVAKDVCAILDIANHRNAVAKLGAKQKGVKTVDTPGGPQEMTVVTEAGVYAIAFTCLDQSGAARRFLHWLASEGLPFIMQGVSA